MVSLEQDDGLVTLRFVAPPAEDDEEAYLAALDKVGKLAGPFALLTVLGGGRVLSHTGERGQALWFKATRARMNEECRGIAMVRPGATAETAAVFQRLWTFPVSVEPDEATARAVLRTYLEAAP